MQKRNLIILILFFFVTIASVLIVFVSVRISLAFITGIILAAVIFFKPFYGVLIYIILLYVRPQDFIPFLGKLRIMLILAACIVISFFIHKIMRKEKISIFHSRQGILMVILLIIVPISNLANFRLLSAWEGFNEFLTVFIPFFLIVNLVDNFDKFRKVCWTLVICTMVISTNGLIQHFRGLDLIGIEPVLGRIRWIGIFGDPNDFALSINVFLPFVLLNISGKEIKTTRKLALAIVGIVFITAIYYTNSRGGFIALLLVLTLFVFKQWGITKGLIALTILLFGSLLFAPERMGELSPYEASASGRINAWIDGLVILKAHPVFGVGFQNFQLFHVRAAHSAFIQCMAELGLIGYYVWLALLYTCFSGLRNIEKAGIKHYSKYAGILQLSLVGFSGSAIFLSQAYNPILYIIVALSAVVINNSNISTVHNHVKEFIKILSVLIISIVFYKFLAALYI